MNGHTPGAIITTTMKTLIHFAGRGTSTITTRGGARMGPGGIV